MPSIDINQIALTCVAIFFSGILAAQEPLYEINDSEITNRIETELMFQSEVPSYWIDVETDNRMVSLTGTVNNILAKDQAEHVAMAVKGVEGVINRIEVDPVTRSDSEIKEDVRMALMANPATESYELDLSVDDGTVSLYGDVQSWQEKKLAAYVTKGVRGVKAIDNRIEMTYLSERPDAEIEQEIEQAIENDIRLEKHLISVKVNDGEVTLRGKVGTLNEKRQAENYAWTAGVESVNTEPLTIRDWTREDYLRKQTWKPRSDAQIKEAVELAFLYDPRVMSFEPEVSVMNGVVTLTGNVDNLKAKRAAEADAANIFGVTNVRNHLKVRPAVIPDDEVLQRRVKESFLRDTEIERHEIEINAEKGVIYLDGRTDNYYEKYRAEDLASQTKGVVDVVNDLDVSSESNYDAYYPYSWNTYYPSPYIYPDTYYTYPPNDKQVKENIVGELWWSPFVDEDQVNVSVDSGIATLSGTVDTWNEREAAVENAYEGGADAVIDNLQVSAETQ